MEKNKMNNVNGGRRWFLISGLISALMLIVTVIVTKVPFLSNTLSAVFGGTRIKKKGSSEAAEYFTSDYADKKSVLEAANALNEEIESEGIILLKNEGTLPIPTPVSDSTVKTSPKVSIFGKNSTNLVYGGSGSSGSSTDGAPTIYDAFEKAGYEVNPVLKEFYEGSSSGSGRPSSPSMGNILTGYPIGETPVASFTDAVKESYASYGDAAFVVISRIGGEGYDLPRTMKMTDSGDYTCGFTKKEAWTSETPVDGARSVDSHYLQLDQNETDLLKEVCASFGKVVLVINSAAPLELGFLDDPEHYAYQKNLTAAVWIGDPGFSGIYALGSVLNGEITPSGHLVDTYARDFTSAPSWQNFGNNMSYMGNRYLVNGKMSSKYPYFTVDYEEGIYVGYRYYETRGAEKVTGGEGEEWYRKNVVFPLGYGMSYTAFQWELVNREQLQGSEISKDREIEFRVRVKNTGSYAGKDVVQIYVSAPYTDGGLEKAYKVLAGFVKTETLNPGESCEAVVSVKPYDFAVFNTEKGCFELEEGEYRFFISFNAHDQMDGAHAEAPEPVVLKIPEGGILYKEDPVTGTEVKALFPEASAQLACVLSRTNWDGTWPSAPTEEERDMTGEFMDGLVWTENDQPGDPWYAEEMPVTGQSGERQLYEYIGKDYEDESWDELLNQVTVDEMVNLTGIANYNTAAVSSVGKPRTIDPDGPSGFTLFMGDPSVYDTCFYACECVLAASWNTELAHRMGNMVGNEGILGDIEGKGNNVSYSGWYAPAANIHRSPFGGRNWEYYSEDGFLSGKMAAEVCAGTREKGVTTYMKHFALNDQETNRDSNGLLTWATEQSMRELYFKPFEIAVKEGGTHGIMSSFNRIGSEWTGGSYALLTELLRKEWGFQGNVVTDYNMLSSYMSADQMIRAGGDLNLSQDGRPSGELTATQVSCLRKATKNVLYTTANSCAMNGLGKEVTIEYGMPYWQMALIALDCGVIGSLFVIGEGKRRKQLREIKEK